MGLKVRISTVGAIGSTLEEFEGVSSTDGIKFLESVITMIPTEAEVVEFREYELGVALGVKKRNGDVTYISHKWCSSITDGVNRSKFLDEVSLLSSTYIKVSDNKVIDIVTNTIKNTSELPICSECGTPTNTVVNGVKLCDDCLSTKFSKLAEYNYKPTPNFIGEQLRKDVDTPYYYGIELEYGLQSKLPMAKLVHKHQTEVYLKKDGSINGGNFKAELVTHPHSFKKLMSDCFLDSIGTLDDVPNRASNGCHIHVSRDAFLDSRHYAKWYFLIHEMKSINEYIGGRQLTNYCSFKPTGHIYTKHKEDKGGGEKSVMINERNDATIECRFFSSTSDASEVRSFVQYLESLIKYTKYSEDTVTVEGWLAYVRRYKKKYNHLEPRLDGYSGEFRGGVTYREPKVTRKSLQDIMFNDSTKISKIETRDRTYNDVTNFRMEGSDRVYFHYDNSRDSKTIEISNIVAVEWID